MGHKDDNTFQAYIGRASGVDVQAIASGESPDQELVDFVTSMETSVDRNAPLQHGSLLVHARKRNSRPPDDDEPSACVDVDTYNPFDGTETAAPFNSAPVRHPPSRYLLAYLKHDPLRADFVMKADASSTTEDQSLHDVVGPLCSMAVPDNAGWSYPGAQPSEDGTCSHCGRDVSNRYVRIRPTRQREGC